MQAACHFVAVRPDGKEGAKRMLDTHRLKIFLKVADLKSFSKAAHELYLTQPTVSQHIHSLEQHIGIPLFDRCGKEALLTRAGEILYGYAWQIIVLHSEAEQALDHFQGKKSGTMVLGASTIPGEYLLPGLLGKFKQAYPGIQVAIRISDTAGIVNQLLDRVIELGVVGARIKDDRLQYARFIDDELVLIIPRGHRWWSRNRVGPADLAQEPFVIRERGSGTRISMDHHLKKAGITPERLNLIAEVGSTTAVKEAVKANLGISFISRRAVEEELKAGIFKTVPVERLQFMRTFYIVSERKRAFSPLVEAFVAFLHRKS